MAGSEKKKPAWAVTMSTSADKMANQMPQNIQILLATLIADIEAEGPIQKEWSHFSKLGKTKRVPENAYHCHLKSGRPTYVVCWRANKTGKTVEVFYVGTHEGAPYQK